MWKTKKLIVGDNPNGKTVLVWERYRISPLFFSQISHSGFMGNTFFISIILDGYYPLDRIKSVEEIG